jgi:DNA primase
MQTPSIDFADIASRVDLRALIEADCGPPNRSRKYLCPFHADTNPSLGINPDGRHWKCWSCGAGGDAFDWIARQENCTVAEAARRLDPTLGGDGDRRSTRPTPTVKEPKPEPTPSWHASDWQSVVDDLIGRAEATLWSAEGRDALAWLRGRGLENLTLKRFRLGFLPDEGWTSPVEKPDGTISGIHFERGVLIPWLAPGAWYSSSTTPGVPRWCGANVRRLMPDVNESLPEGEEKCKAIRGSRRGHFYPWPDILPSQPILPALLLEGEIDSLLGVQEAGWLAHIGTVGGATQPPQRSALAALAVCPTWIIATDRDEAGVEAAWAWRERAPHKARRALIPHGKDIGDFVQAGGNVAEWLAGELARLGP